MMAGVFAEMSPPLEEVVHLEDQAYRVELVLISLVRRVESVPKDAVWAPRRKGHVQKLVSGFLPWRGLLRLSWAVRLGLQSLGFALISRCIPLHSGSSCRVCKLGLLW